MLILFLNELRAFPSLHTRTCSSAVLSLLPLLQQACSCTCGQTTRWTWTRAGGTRSRST
jgi:hypothetical protein